MEETHHQNAETRLLGPKQLLSGAWRLFRSRIKTLLALMLIPAVSFVAAVGLSLLFIALMPENLIWLTVLLIVAVAIVAIIAMVPVYPAIFVDLKEESNIGWKRSYLQGFKYFWTYLWISILTGLAILGGFVLLVIPGIMVFVWLYFAPMLAVLEDARGTDALRKSREYVRGRWWPVFWRILVPLILMWILQSLTAIFPKNMEDIAEGAVSLVWTPFSAAYAYLLYKELHRTHVHVAKQNTVAIFIWIGIAAIIALIGFFLWFVANPGLI